MHPWAPSRKFHFNHPDLMEMYSETNCPRSQRRRKNSSCWRALSSSSESWNLRPALVNGTHRLPPWCAQVQKRSRSRTRPDIFRCSSPEFQVLYFLLFDKWNSPPARERERLGFARLTIDDESAEFVIRHHRQQVLSAGHHAIKSKSW